MHQKASSKVIAIIPARYHSNRFEGKPLADILGKPMIQHVYERAVSVDLLSRVAVATDDDRIADCVRGFGGEVVMTRNDHVSGTDRLAEGQASNLALYRWDRAAAAWVVLPSIVNTETQRLSAITDQLDRFSAGVECLLVQLPLIRK